jgi:hypothetical protein
VKDGNGDLLAESHILNRWKNYFSQLLNAHRVTDVRQIETYISDMLVLDLSPVEVETVTSHLKCINRYIVIKFRQN